MARRSDHNRADLEAMILNQGHALMAQTGYAQFSAREVAKRIGYSVGSIYHVYGNHDRLVLAINSLTFLRWADHLRIALDAAGADRIAALVHGYFSFAQENRNLWTAIYDHRLPPDMTMPPDHAEQRGVLTGIVTQEVAAALPAHAQADAPRLARSLIATVHGHCDMALNGSFALMEESDPAGLALARVREALAAA